ncbi:hypothetical protein [Paenibacillus sp. ISL-20]|uniref:hypothetical protein n=1 Tax=Paenibacillus sp. ISL-20 TaxID=2819163 RepID=UPI001BEA0216|nr:hypothetical protein [Paenibacillus sp. ISL-20]MBT2761894.1 hypothetical protein [Paenibacillus sp. ISL-20]
MKRVVSIFICVIIILTGCASPSGQTDEPVENAIKTEPVVKEPESNPLAPPDPKPKESVFEWHSADVSEDNVRLALENNVGAAMAIPIKDETFRKFTSSEDLEGQYIELTINPGTYWDEKDFVKKAGGSLIAYSKILFENPEVYEVSLDVKIDNGGGGENDGVYISWRRDQAENVDYDSVLDNMFGDFTIPYTLARKYRIDSRLYDKLGDIPIPRDHNL